MPSGCRKSGTTPRSVSAWRRARASGWRSVTCEPRRAGSPVRRPGDAEARRARRRRGRARTPSAASDLRADRRMPASATVATPSSTQRARSARACRSGTGAPRAPGVLRAPSRTTSAWPSQPGIAGVCSSCVQRGVDPYPGGGPGAAVEVLVRAARPRGRRRRRARSTARAPRRASSPTAPVHPRRGRPRDARDVRDRRRAVVDDGEQHDRDVVVERARHVARPATGVARRGGVRGRAGRSQRDAATALTRHLGRRRNGRSGTRRGAPRRASARAAGPSRRAGP